MPTVEEAAAAVEKAKADLAAAESAQLEAQASAPPRRPDVILLDFMSKVAQRFGNHHELAGLIAEAKKSMSLEEQPPAKE
jgi:hypothetical protein